MACELPETNMLLDGMGNGLCCLVYQLVNHGLNVDHGLDFPLPLCRDGIQASLYHAMYVWKVYNEV